MRYAGVLISGVLGGLGGIVYITAGVSEWKFENGVAGFGFLALAVMIFGQWKPVNIGLAALLFGMFRLMYIMVSELWQPCTFQVRYTICCHILFPLLFWHLPPRNQGHQRPKVFRTIKDKDNTDELITARRRDDRRETLVTVNSSELSEQTSVRRIF